MEYIWLPGSSQSTLTYIISKDADVYLGLVAVKKKIEQRDFWGVCNNQGSKIISLFSFAFSLIFFILETNQSPPLPS